MNNWTVNETEEDRKKSWGLSLKQESYRLPILKVHFGEQEFLVPQVAMAEPLATCMGSMTVKECVYASQRKKVIELYDLASEEIPFYTAEQLSADAEEKKEAVLKFIEKRLEQDGPYVVLGEVFNYSYFAGQCYEIQSALSEEEHPFEMELGEEKDYENEKGEDGR